MDNELIDEYNGFYLNSAALHCREKCFTIDIAKYKRESLEDNDAQGMIDVLRGGHVVEVSDRVLNPTSNSSESPGSESPGSDSTGEPTTTESSPLPTLQYPEILFLGTGSSIPCKVRNVSAIWLNLRFQSHSLYSISYVFIFFNF